MVPLGLPVDWAQARANGMGFLEEPVFPALPCNITGFLGGEVAWLGLEAKLVMPEVAALQGRIYPSQHSHH